MRKHWKKITNAIDDARPMHIWGKGCAGKGGRTHNASIPEPKQTVKSNDNK